MRGIIPALLGLVLFAACGGGGSSGQPVVSAPYENYFDDPSPMTGWYYWDNDPNTAPSLSVSTLWDADATPASMAGGAFFTSPNSLNYNNGTNYDVGTNSGAAISPFLDISGMSFPVCAFRCNYETETDGETYDQRHVRIGYLDSGNSPVYYLETQLSTVPGSSAAGPCDPMGNWHLHIISLDPSWGQVHVAFGFDSVDGFANDNPGWFVDNFQVVEIGDVDYGTPTVPPPPGGGGGAPPPPPPPPGGGGGGVTPPPGGGGTPPPGPVSLLGTSFAPGTTAGWTLTNSSGTVGWNYDGAPASVAGGAAYTGTESLNYNDDIDYDDGVANNGDATSPAVDITGTVNPKLQFWCNFETETGGVTYDQRWLFISNDNFVTDLISGQFAGTGALVALGDCAAMGTWHQHIVDLDPAWGLIQVRFRFDTVDNFSNTFAGHFIDDFEVIADSAPGGGTGVGVGGSGSGSVAGFVEHEGSNGDSDWWNTVCSGRAQGSGYEAAIVLVLALLALSIVVQTLRTLDEQS